MAFVLTLSTDIEKRLERIARRKRCTVADLANEIFRQHVEDAEDAFEAERILRRVQSGRERTLTLDEVEKRLGLKC